MLDICADLSSFSGRASATVVWCPPATGAGSVVSYTVTSSGGQQVTAAVPNDCAIIDGLTDGTSYTFTVTANTKSGPPGPPATSNAVTPEPIAPPSNVLLGTPQKVGYDQYSMTIGGQRVYVTAGRCPGLGRCRLPVPVPWPAGAGRVT
jgi:hypothetical protein